MSSIAGLREFIEPVLIYSGKRLDKIAKLLHVSVDVFREVLSKLPGVLIEDDRVYVSNRLELVLYGLKLGLPVKRLSKYLNWSDFEKMSAEILGRHGYIVASNVRMDKPCRLEIDVVGVDTGSGRTVSIDCKHWRHGISPSSIIEHGRRQIDRTVKFLKHLSWLYRRYPYFTKIKYAIPVLITLTTPRIRSVDNRLVVVSISELNNFLQDLYLVLDELDIKPISLNKVTEKSSSLHFYT